MPGTESGMGTGQINMVWGWRELPSIDGGTTCVCEKEGRRTERREREERKRGERERREREERKRGEREREREERERGERESVKWELIHSLNNVTISTIALLTIDINLCGPRRVAL